MRYIYSITISLFLLGCSTNDIDYTLARMAGNKPAGFFALNSVEEVNKWSFKTKDYKALPPMTYKKDWGLMSPWNGAYIYGGISFGIENPDVNEKGLSVGYGINMSSSITTYEEREKAIEYKKNQYIQSNIKYGKDKYGREGNINVHYETHGKENYPCIVREVRDIKRGIKKISYDCYKFNPERTMAKSVVIRLVYTKSPTLPKELEPLAKEYTYKDLLKRSQRVLDSLYIKDGWDE